MNRLADPILADLARVADERTLRAATPGLAAKVDSIKRFQQLRFAESYDTLLASDRYAPAARFFLDELYGPRDFTQRDAEFSRVVPSIARLFPKSVLEVVGTLTGLHALSEQLDTAMGVQVSSPEVDSTAYQQAWQRCGKAELRERQICMTIELGHALDQLTRKPLLRQSLRLMRGPAQAAGLGELQRLLERGFDAFRAMRGAEEFLAIVARHERRQARRLFGTDDAAMSADDELSAR